MKITLFKLALAVGAALTVIGCASTGGKVVPYGKDTFNLSMSNYGSYPKVRADTIQVANQHCVSLGKLFSPVTETKSSRDGGFAPIYTLDLTFRCLRADDPNYRQPNMEQSPDVLIESR